MTESQPSNLEQGAELLKYGSSIHVNAPPSRVFDIVSDLARSPEWAGSGAIRSIRKTTEGPVGVGTKYESSEKITMPYHAETEIATFEPEELIVWGSKPVGERVPRHRWSFKLAADGEGTILEHQVRVARARGFMGWIQSVGFLFTKPKERVPAGMDKTLLNVKRLAEAEATPDLP
jgi:uncharacterized protein YndB with AHSA1/START domain